MAPMTVQAIPPSPERMRSVSWALPAWLSLGAVLYITLMPFRFDDLGLAQAWEIYRSMEWPRMKSRARQEWVANVLLFMPLGFCWMAWLSGGMRSPAARLVTGALACLFCLAVTASVEFMQTWMPLREPSPADLSANFTGGVLGVLAWCWFHPRWPRWRDALRTQGLQRALALYAIVYLLVGLLPFDLLLSMQELRTKLSSGHAGWWIAGAGCGAGLRCTLSRLLEAAISVPLGVYLALRWKLDKPGRRTLGLAAALGVGVAMELGQLFTVSGIAEGRSVLVRAAGVCIGLLCHAGRERLLRRDLLARHGRALVAWAAVPYVLTLLALNTGIRGFHFDLARAGRTLADLHFLPFYYHYLVSQAAAIGSVMSHMAMYAPVGAAVWLWGLASYAPHRRRYGVAAAWAGALAVLMETAKLFVAGRHPDYTDALIAMFAAVATLFVLSWLWRQSFAPAATAPADGAAAAAPAAVSEAVPGVVPKAVPGAVPAAMTALAPSSPVRFMRLLGVALGVLVLYAASNWPVAAGWLLLGLAAYAALLWRYPAVWLLVIPALVPVLNLSLYSGRFFFDELDLFVLATLAVAAWRWRTGRARIDERTDERIDSDGLPRVTVWALVVFGCSLLAGVVFTLLPWQAPGVDDWVQYGSRYNALRAAKGFVWAVLLYTLLRQSALPVPHQLRRYFVPGMVSGLALGILIVLRERMVYPGLFDFDSGYRISGAFADMHVGGPSIEAWLVMATPFILLWAWQRRSPWCLLPALALFVLAMYALAVTYARGGYFGMAVALLLAMAGLLAAWRVAAPAQRWRLAVLLLLPMGAVGVIIAQVGSGFAGQRMAQIDADMAQRLAYWRSAMDLAKADGGVNWFGNGPGSFPRIYLTANADGRIPANFSLIETLEGNRLRLGAGDSLFINQRIDLPRVPAYSLEMRVRAAAPAALGVFVCEKSARYSFDCHAERFRIPVDETGAWTDLRWAFGLEDFTVRPAPLQRGLTLAIAHYGGTGVLEIDRVRLLDAGGADYLRNGAFDQGLRYWYMSSDHLDAWRIENQWIEIWFDQGWLGLLAFGLLVLAALLQLGAAAVRGRAEEALLLASLAGVLAVGVFSTVFWSPRLMMLFFLVLLLALAYSRAAEAERGGH